MVRLASVLGAALFLAVPAAAAGDIHLTRLTASYNLTLSVGPKETMYTAAEAKAKHLKSGEVMLDDSMGGMAMGAGNRHLEVQVRSRKTSRVLSLRPSSITLTDTSAASGMAMADKLQVMAMEGIGKGMADLHYGNNVKLTAGHAYKVVVIVKGEKATFSFKA